MSQIQKWEQLARNWEAQGPPATPSTQDLDNFCHIIQQQTHFNINRTIGILGCTPGLRTKMRQDWPDAEIILFDFSPGMHKATSSIVDENTKKSERYVAIDWLQIQDHFENQIDILVGDKSLDNVPLEDWEDFFISSAKSLKSAGLLVLHVGFPDPKMVGLSFTDLINPWLSIAGRDGAGMTKAAAGLWEDLLSGSARDSTEYLSLEPYKRDLESHARSDTPVGRLALRILDDFATTLDARWAKFDEHAVTSAAMQAGFNIIGRRHSTDYAAARNQPILGFRRT